MDRPRQILDEALGDNDMMYQNRKSRILMTLYDAEAMPAAISPAHGGISNEKSAACHLTTDDNGTMIETK